MGYFVNLVLYNLIRFEATTQRLFDVPVRWFVRRRWVQQAYRRRDIDDPEARIVQVLDDPGTGVGSALAAAHLSILFFLALSGTLNFVLAAGGLAWRWWLLVPTALAAYLGPEVLAYRKRRYQAYFREFDAKPADWRRRTAVQSTLAVIGIWSYGILGFAVYLRAAYS